MAEQLAVADLQVDIKQIPLKQPFVTALHRVDAVNAVRVTVRLANGVTGIGTCTPNEKVTGDSLSSARAVIEETIKPLVLEKNLTDWKELLNTVKTSIVHNAPAKAAVEIALYNTRANLFGLTLSQLLGGKGGSVETDYTISIGKAEQMIANAQKMVDQGFKTLKLKLGAGHLKRDIKLVEDLAYATGPMVHLRLDMNQAWDVRQTMQAAEYWHKQGLLIDFIEQPVPAWDRDSMAYLTRHSPYPIMADESVESYEDAQRVLAKNACDYINIKLMKTGGLSEAQKINDLAESRGVPTMVGSMIESIESLAAACAFYRANPNTIFADLDAIFMVDQDPDLNSYAECFGDNIVVR